MYINKQFAIIHGPNTTLFISKSNNNLHLCKVLIYNIDYNYVYYKIYVQFKNSLLLHHRYTKNEKCLTTFEWRCISVEYVQNHGPKIAQYIIRLCILINNLLQHTEQNTRLFVSKLNTIFKKTKNQ